MTADDKLNCWDYFKCGREIFARHRKDSVCVVSITSCNNGLNEGINSGRYCWKIPGSLCQSNLGGDQGSIKYKEEHCQTCSFRKLVEMEEGENFIP